MNHPINITVDRVAEMDEREMYNVSDCYVKNKLSRFAVNPGDQAALRQRETPRSDRDGPLADTAEIFDEVKAHIYDVLYDPRILPRHLFALKQMRQSVESQLAEYTDQGDWRRSARGFLDLVKDELGRAEVMLELQREQSARRHVETLLEAIQEHRDAEDVDQADDKLYLVADEIAAALDPADDLSSAPDASLSCA